MASEWQPDIERLENDHNRDFDRLASMHKDDVDRLENEIKGCITEQFYTLAQTQVGERISSVKDQISKLEERTQSEKTAREKNANAIKLTMLGAGFTGLIGAAIELLKLVGGK